MFVYGGKVKLEKTDHEEKLLICHCQIPEFPVLEFQVVYPCKTWISGVAGKKPVIIGRGRWDRFRRTEMSVVLSELGGDEGGGGGGGGGGGVGSHGFGGVCEIEEEEEDGSELFEISHGFRMASNRESLFSLDMGSGSGEENVYVAVGKCESSMDALSWTLKNAVTPSTIVYLVHVFPEIRHVATPCKLSAPDGIADLIFFCFYGVVFMFSIFLPVYRIKLNYSEKCGISP